MDELESDPMTGGGSGGAETGGDGPSEPPSRAWTSTALSALRARRDRRIVALVLVAVVGLAVAWVHWLGLFVAGVLVGLASKTLPRALIAGFALGVLVLLVHVLVSPMVGPGEFLALSPPAYVTIAAGLAAPVWGSLVRGVV